MPGEPEDGPDPSRIESYDFPESRVGGKFLTGGCLQRTSAWRHALSLCTAPAEGLGFV
jgi:hypothetical protein